MPFVLHPRLRADTWPVGDLALSRLLLMNDSRFPWLILVPRRDALVEIFDLSPAERALVIEEISAVAEALSATTNATKMNVGALGNVVSQLHVHVVARHDGDAAWPGPVWGSGTAWAYRNNEAASLIEALSSRLALA